MPTKTKKKPSEDQMALPIAANGAGKNGASKKKTNGKARNGAAVYDESKVKTLSSLEHIRLRSGMYIGRLGDGTDPDDGIYVLVKETNKL